MDDVDLTSTRQAIIDTANLANSHKPEPQGQANGNCWQCKKPVPDKHRWCNAICRDNWQADNNLGG